MFLQVKYNPLLQICSVSLPSAPPSGSHILKITSDSGIKYLGWNGTSTYSNILEISTMYASKLGLKQDEWVSTDWVIADLIDNIEVAPADENSWEVVSKNVQLIENILLTQIQVVYKELEFPIWIGTQAQCSLKVVNISREYGKLGINTELYVQVKGRNTQSNVQPNPPEIPESEISEEIKIPESLNKECITSRYYETLTDEVCEEISELNDDISVVEGCSGSGKSSLLTFIAKKIVENKVESIYIECNKLSTNNNQHLNALHQAFVNAGSKKRAILILDNVHVIASKPELFEASVGDKLIHCLTAIRLAHLKEVYPTLKILITCHDFDNLHLSLIHI